MVVSPQGRQGKRWRREKIRSCGMCRGRQANGDHEASEPQPGRKTDPAVYIKKVNLRDKRQDPLPRANARRKAGPTLGTEGKESIM